MNPSDPLDELQWRSPEWIQMNAGLRTDNILDYFAISPFYDRSSNNQVLKMQSQFQGPGGGPGASGGSGTAAGATPSTAMPPLPSGTAYVPPELRAMKGTEFVVALAREPELWVIRKQTRFSPTETRPIATYFVVGDNVYMAPAVMPILESRLISTTLNLSKALKKAAALHGFSPSEGYFYKKDEVPGGGQEEGGVSTSNSSTAATNTTSTTGQANQGARYGEDRIHWASIERAMANAVSGSPAYVDEVILPATPVPLTAGPNSLSTTDLKAKALNNQAMTKRRRNISK